MRIGIRSSVISAVLLPIAVKPADGPEQEWSLVDGDTFTIAPPDR